MGCTARQCCTSADLQVSALHRAVRLHTARGAGPMCGGPIILLPQGFPAARATRALYHSGGENLEAALGWLEEHQVDAGHTPGWPAALLACGLQATCCPHCARTPADARAPCSNACTFRFSPSQGDADLDEPLMVPKVRRRAGCANAVQKCVQNTCSGPTQRHGGSPCLSACHAAPLPCLLSCRLHRRNNAKQCCCPACPSNPARPCRALPRRS